MISPINIHGTNGIAFFFFNFLASIKIMAPTAPTIIEKNIVNPFSFIPKNKPIIIKISISPSPKPPVSLLIINIKIAGIAAPNT